MSSKWDRFDRYQGKPYHRSDLTVETHDLASELATRIRAARVLSRKKVPELAQEIGWSVKRLYRVERGDSAPSAVELAAIAEATGQPLDFFYGNTSPVEPNGATISRSTGGVK